MRLTVLLSSAITVLNSGPCVNLKCDEKKESNNTRLTWYGMVAATTGRQERQRQQQRQPHQPHRSVRKGTALLFLRVTTILGIVGIAFRNLVLSSSDVSVQDHPRQRNPSAVEHALQETRLSKQPSSSSSSSSSSSVVEVASNTTTATQSKTKILGFADYNYRDYAIRWFHRLESLGYQEHTIVAVDQKAVDFFQYYSSTSSSTTLSTTVTWEPLPYPPCVAYKRNPKGYRHQIFGRRWKYIYEQLQLGHHVLMTDVDNVFSRHLPMSSLEASPYDVFHAFSTSYPTDVFEEMGLTVCGGMSWLRASPKVIRFVGSLVNECGCQKAATNDEGLCTQCQCDDQVVLNNLLWKGKHKVVWNESLAKPTSLKDWRWKALEGVSSKTQHNIFIWDRSIAYRAPMPETCPPENWVSMPLYVDRQDVVETWDRLCGSPLHNKQ